MRNQRHGCDIICLILILVGLLGSCTASPPDYFAWRTASFCAEVRGTLNERDFCAKITAEGGEENGMRTVTVHYLAPDILADTEVQAVMREEGALTGEARITRGEMEITQDATTLSGLFSPITCLFVIDELEAVQKTEKGYILSFSGDVTLTLTADGLPVRYSSPTVQFDVVWWEG